MPHKIIMLFFIFLCIIGCSGDMAIDPITYGYTRGLKTSDRDIKIATCGKYPIVNCKDEFLKDSSICKKTVDSIWFKPKWILIDFLDENLEKKDSLSEVYYGGPLTKRNFKQNYWRVQLVGEWFLTHIEDSLSDTSRALDTLNRYVDILIYENIKICMDDQLASDKVAIIAKEKKYSLDVAEYIIKNEQRKIYGDSARLFFTERDS